MAESRKMAFAWNSVVPTRLRSLLPAKPARVKWKTMSVYVCSGTQWSNSARRLALLQVKPSTITAASRCATLALQDRSCIWTVIPWLVLLRALASWWTIFASTPRTVARASAANCRTAMAWFSSTANRASRSVLMGQRRILWRCSARPFAARLLLIKMKKYVRTSVSFMILLPKNVWKAARRRLL